MTLYLGLGSNVGERRAQLEQALEALGPAGIAVLQRSSYYESAPRDVLDQPWFLNLVVKAETELTARQVLQAIQAIETAGGRTRLVPRGPRTLDIDLLFFGDETIQMPDLEVPHPRLWERRFVVEPLGEIAPALVSDDARAAVAAQEIRRVVD